MASLIVISWRDVPAQIVVKRGRETAKIQLSHRFQEAVDRAAMRAGRGSSDAYLEDWRRAAPQPCGDELQAEGVVFRSDTDTEVIPHLIARRLAELAQLDRARTSRATDRISSASL